MRLFTELDEDINRIHNW